MDAAILWAMSDENVQRVESRFVEGETVEFLYKKKWRPATVLSKNNLITDHSVQKKWSESFKRNEWDFFVQIEYFHKRCVRQVNVLQTSKRMAFTNTHIREGTHYYDRMVTLMRGEPEDVREMRRTREKHRLTAVNAFHTSLSRIRRNKDTMPERAEFSTFLSPKPIDKNNIKPSGTQRK